MHSYSTLYVGCCKFSPFCEEQSDLLSEITWHVIYRNSINKSKAHKILVKSGQHIYFPPSLFWLPDLAHSPERQLHTHSYQVKRRRGNLNGSPIQLQSIVNSPVNNIYSTNRSRAHTHTNYFPNMRFSLLSIDQQSETDYNGVKLWLKLSNNRDLDTEIIKTCTMCNRYVVPYLLSRADCPVTSWPAWGAMAAACAKLSSAAALRRRACRDDARSLELVRRCRGRTRQFINHNYVFDPLDSSKVNTLGAF